MWFGHDKLADKRKPNLAAKRLAAEFANVAAAR
jgi:hypothetical protein